jgi:uncharacterized phage protein (TIGR01671 family)
MREHKYRDYDPEKKEIRYFDLDHYDKEEHNQWCNIMQYTGLKDKNGVEIYEGDVLQDDERPVECGVVEWDYDSLIVNNAQITPEWRKTTVESGLKYRHWIIIGNIYENPELLDKK